MTISPKEVNRDLMKNPTFENEGIYGIWQSGRDCFVD